MTRISATELRDIRAEAARLATSHLETGISAEHGVEFIAHWQEAYITMILEGPVAAINRHAKARVAPRVAALVREWGAGVPDVGV